jgi:hypothetical protein
MVIFCIQDFFVIFDHYSICEAAILFYCTYIKMAPLPISISELVCKKLCFYPPGNNNFAEVPY